MLTMTMPSVQAQNNFGALIDTAQRGIVSITRRKRPVALVMSPQVLEDYLDGHLATQAEAGGFASQADTQAFLNTLRDA